MAGKPIVTLSGRDGAALSRAAELLEADGYAVVLEQAVAEQIVVGSVAIDLDRREVTASDGTVVRPTASEFEVLVMLAANRGVVIGRRQVLDAALDQPFIDPRTVDTYVMQLRRRIPGLVIETVRGVGYRIPLTD